jgi:uncharacterized protein
MTSDVVPATRPRRLLSIDGGGLLGLIPAESLIEMEKQLDAMTGTAQPLCNRFDLIGGTSTGAILAAGLGLGLRAEQLRDFYLEYGREIFTKSWLLERLWHSYPSGPLERRLKQVLGESTTLGSERLQPCIMIVAKNATLGSTWFFSNNQKGKFFRQNSGLPLWQLVRASSAAPTYFPPAKIAVENEAGQKQTCEFVDGGVSSYNNPSLQVFLEATEPGYGFEWATGTDKLLLLSLGTGYNSLAIAEGKATDYTVIDWAKYVVKELMGDANLQQNVLMHLLGERPSTAQSASAEMAMAGASVGTPSDNALNRVTARLGPNKLLTYQRITISLTPKRLQGLGLGDIDPVKVREMDAADQIPNMQRIGAAVAKEQVRMDAVRNFFRDSGVAAGNAGT